MAYQVFFPSFCVAYNQGQFTFFSLAYQNVYMTPVTQSFLGYILLTKPAFHIFFPLFSIMCTSTTGGIVMNRRQL